MGSQNQNQAEIKQYTQGKWEQQDKRDKEKVRGQTIYSTYRCV